MIWRINLWISLNSLEAGHPFIIRLHNYLIRVFDLQVTEEDQQDTTASVCRPWGALSVVHGDDVDVDDETDWELSPVGQTRVLCCAAGRTIYKRINYSARGALIPLWERDLHPNFHFKLELHNANGSRSDINYWYHHQFASRLQINQQLLLLKWGSSCTTPSCILKLVFILFWRVICWQIHRIVRTTWT